jgi:hypothetical protein
MAAARNPSKECSDDSDDARDDPAAGIVPRHERLAIAPARRPRMMKAMIPIALRTGVAIAVSGDQCLRRTV